MTTPTPRIAVVTPQVRAVIGELARDGADNAVIAARLNITAHTVRTHLKAAFAATGARNRTHLVCLLLRGQVQLRTEPRRRTEDLENAA